MLPTGQQITKATQGLFLIFIYSCYCQKIKSLIVKFDDLIQNRHYDDNSRLTAILKPLCHLAGDCGDRTTPGRTTAPTNLHLKTDVAFYHRPIFCDHPDPDFAGSGFLISCFQACDGSVLVSKESDGDRRDEPAGAVLRPSEPQRRYLERGLSQPGGKLPLFYADGREVASRTVQACVANGWAEPWFRNPIKPEWLVCRLTPLGRQAVGGTEPAVSPQEPRTPKRRRRAKSPESE
jgi:hypothetical protein